MSDDLKNKIESLQSAVTTAIEELALLGERVGNSTRAKTLRLNMTIMEQMLSITGSLLEKIETLDNEIQAANLRSNQK